MIKEELSELEIKILEAVQNEIPICARPFEAIAAGLSEGGEPVSEAMVLEALESLRARKYIRRMGPVFDAAELGYKSVLAAVRMEESRIAEAAVVINSYGGVTHNYLREGAGYNLWFTVTAETDDGVREALEEIKKKLGLDDYLMLPAERTYKIKVGFKVGK